MAGHFQLGSMDAETVRDYIRHRRTKAGGSADIFDTEACALVHENSGGIPRVVNQLSDLCMVYAFANGDLTVTSETVIQVLEDGVFFAGGLRQDALRLVDPIIGKS